MKTRILFLIIVSSLLVGCASRVQVNGVYTETLMNGQTVYHAQTEAGDRIINQLVYENLVYKLNNLSAGHGLMCDMEKGLTSGVYDLSCCTTVVLVVMVREARD